MATSGEKTAAKALQAMLITLGYLAKGGDDGNFGKASTRALARFQRHAGRVYRMAAATKVAADVVRVQRMKLSRSSGEAPAETLVAAWGVGSGRALWIWRSSPRDSRLTTLRYARAGLTPAGSPVLVVLGTDDTQVAAQQRRLQGLARTPGAVVLPRQTSAGLRWVTALANADLERAGRRAAELHLPASAVRAFPWLP